ncbi:MAG TPA: hypothetical protein VFG63_06095 [Nocardioidaceae bacterium]|nr:hypothetical protein [Nocardioidaceae bacterium]
MNDHMLERRMLLRGAGLAGATAVGSIALAAPATAHDHDHDHHSHHGDDAEVLGAWMITHMDDAPGDTTPVLGVAGFAKGGVLTVQDIAPLGAGALGAWEARDDDRFKADFWTGFPSAGAGEPAATVNVRLRGKVDDDEIEGWFRFTAYDAATQEELFSGTGTFSGKRIEP